MPLFTLSLAPSLARAAVAATATTAPLRRGLFSRGSVLSNLPVLRRASEAFKNNIAVVDPEHTLASPQAHAHTKHPHHRAEYRTFTYDRLAKDASALARLLLHTHGANDLKEARVCFLTPPTYDYAVMMWGVWQAGGIAVPMCVSHPPAELEYVLKDSGASIVVCHPEYEPTLRKLVSAGQQHLVVVHPSEAHIPTTPVPISPPESLDTRRRALMIYTSGTTGKPKGVVHTHDSIEAQVKGIVASWEITASDKIMNVLPLHHIHGVVNVLTSTLYAGGSVEMPRKFDAEHTWARIKQHGALTLFMAVPTVYSRLIAAAEKKSAEEQAALHNAARALRVMICGSAALPAPVMQRWAEVSGHTLLERYGMTEIGMALTNPLHGARIAGYVGRPFPGVSVRIIGDGGKVLTDHRAAPHLNAQSNLIDIEGDLRIKGANVFLEYWGKPEATAKEFDSDGWFITGDIAKYNASTDSFAILGRASVDIIKSGGYKLSALEIEREILAHPDVAECAILGPSDPEWGQRVAAVIVMRPGAQPLTLDALKTWAADHLAKYKIPTLLTIVPSIEKNALGKVNKKDLVKKLYPSQ